MCWASAALPPLPQKNTVPPLSKDAITASAAAATAVPWERSSRAATRLAALSVARASRSSGPPERARPPFLFRRGLTASSLSERRALVGRGSACPKRFQIAFGRFLPVRHAVSGDVLVEQVAEHRVRRPLG